MWKLSIYGILAALWAASAFIAYNKGVDKCMERKDEAHAAQLKEQQERFEEEKQKLKEGYDKMLADNKEVEVQIQERIVYRDRWRTQIEQVIADNPDSCHADPDRVRETNQLIREANDKLWGK